MGVPYPRQLADRSAQSQQALAGVVPATAWREPFPSKESGFRNKAKLVVAGSRGQVTLGILDHAGAGIDLQGCGLYEPTVAEALAPLAAFINEVGLLPYDVPAKQGELKHLIVTGSSDGQLMVRFVLRSRNQEGRLRKALPSLLGRLPIRVASINLQPHHRAVLEGDTELPLTQEQELPMRVNDVTLLLRPNSFFQTNTDVAAGLYRQAQQWILPDPPTSLWDLYCGVGGFALHAAMLGIPDVLGIEVAPEAVASAQAAARTHGVDAELITGDATAVADRPEPELVIVNPPRRGIGESLTAWLEGSEVHRVVYSSCNPATLARDLAAMPSLRVQDARLFDMFPQTTHQEVMVNLVRS